jgi:hypothetical protein
MFRKLLVLAGLGFAAKKLASLRRPNPSVDAMDHTMHRKGMPGGVRP